jgi:plasmid rolling circle replication initiator protein Rep
MEEIEIGNKIFEVVTGTGERLVDVSDGGKIRNWGKKKAMNLQVAKLYRRIMDCAGEFLTETRYKSLLECGDSLIFGETGGKKKLIRANFCRMRLCPICNWRKSLKMFAQVSRISEELLKEKATTRFLFLTLTVKNCKGEELSRTIDVMNKAFKFLFTDGQTFAAASVIKKNLLGYLRAMEITYNSQKNEYHPHFHVLLAVKPAYFSRDYISQANWREIWARAMKLDYEPQVNIKAVKNVSPNVIAEVAKYPTKVAEITQIQDEEQAAEALKILHRSLKSRRLVTFGGCFREIARKLKLDDVEGGDLVHIETDLVKTLNFVGYTLYQYRAEIGAYIC